MPSRSSEDPIPAGPVAGRLSSYYTGNRGGGPIGLALRLMKPQRGSKHASLES